MRARWQGSCLWAAALFVLASSCHAQSATPDQEYQKLIQVDQSIEPLGEHPFGENISTYDGSVTFNVTDVTLRGNGPTITVGRTLQFFEWVQANNVGPQFPFGSWDLDIPRIETLVGTGGAVASSAIWQTLAQGVGDTGTTQRCTNFYEPPGIASTLSEGGWVSDEWWYGYNLLVPGEGKQLLMPRYSANSLSPTINGMSFNIVTKNNWMISCGVTASDGGEGFLAIAPDGTRYTFAHLLYRPYYPIVGSGGALPPDGTNIATSSTPSAQSAITAQSATPMVGAPGGVGILARQDAFMYVTQIQDRFGNTLTYNYDPTTGYLSSITASDGREVDVAYVSGTPYIQTITAKATNVASRTWTYSYNSTTAVIPSLTGVQLPDGSAWSYNLTIGAQNIQLTSNCQLGELPSVPYPVQGSSVGTVTAPSGITGTFYFGPKLSGRSYAPKECYGSDNGTAPAALFPEWYVQSAITSEVLSGPGLPTQTWSYSYSPANQSWSSDACATSGTCATTVYTDVTDPNGNDTRYTYSNRYDATEGQLQRADTYSGAYGGTLVRSVVNSYANASGEPWPSVYGIDLLYRDNYFQSEQLSPLNQRTITQDGQNYTWYAKLFNAYAQPIDVVRSNDIAGQSSIEETTTYLNDTNLWVLGLPQTVTNAGTGEVESNNSYNTSNDLLQSRSHFGEFMMSYLYNSAGQLASFTDGNGHTTSISNYYRGIPQLITFPDQSTKQLTVDDLSEIRSITDQAGYQTQYNYDPMGRVSQIIYPTNDPNGVVWTNTSISFAPVPSAERGLPAGHWDRVVKTGNATSTSYYDADFRPVVSDTSNGVNTYTVLNTYDYTGAALFTSFPTSTLPSYGTSVPGMHHTYDALGRLTQTQEDSELGALTTTTSYPVSAGGQEQVTDPNHNVTTTYYQMFDEPSYKDPISVIAPGGITQTIVRDIYGNPTSITQSGLYGTENDSVTKTLVYDSYYRLCRTTEPESGSTVMAYDAANNLQWSAQGQTITDGTCGQTDVAGGAQTVRTYDAMNRVKAITPPASTQTTSYTYDARGNISNVVSGSATNTFVYNSRNLLTSQTLSIGSYAWGLAYSYDAYGHVNAIGYPAFNTSSEGVALSPDALGRPTQVGSYASSITYFPNDQVAGFNYGNGASYVAEQNERQLTSNFSDGVGGTLNLSEDFTYDNNGNITAVGDLVPNGPRSKSFTYDGLNRLTSATASNLYGVENYTYDALNNLRTRVTGGNTLTLNYDGSNRLGSVAQNGSVVTQYGYDTQGNRSSLTNGGATTNYNFDTENQLLQVPGLEGYAYDAAGRRVAKTNTSGAPTGYYFYDQAGQLMYSFDPNSLLATNYIYLGTKLIAKHALFAAPPPSAISFSSNPNGGSFTVSWGGVSQATSYTLQQLAVATGTWTTVYSGASLSSAISGLAAGTYQYRVQACVSSGCGNWTTSPNVDVWPPLPSVSVPPGIVAGTYTVSWSASANASSYTVQEAVNGGAWNTIGTGAATSIKRPGTTTGTYTYQVEALDASGVTGGFGSVSNPVTVNAALLPSPPPTLSVPTSSNTSSATISWTAASPVTGYTLQESANGGASWTTVYSGTATSAALSGLSDGTYTFQLQACNAPGSGNYCTNWIAEGSLVVALPPGTSTITPSTTSSNTGAYSLSWTAPATSTSYVLQQQVNGGAWTTVQSSAATTWSVSGEGNATYGYRVQACYQSVCGGWSATVAVTVLLPPASAPTISGAGTSTNGSYILTWNTVATATNYAVYYIASSTNWVLEQDTAATSYTTTQSADGSYEYVVVACNGGGCGPTNNAVVETVLFPPATAPTLSVSQPSLYSDTIDLSWTSVATATSYWWQYSKDQTTWTRLEGLQLNSTTYAPGTGVFYFEVQACNASGCGPWSPVVEKTVVDK